MTDFDAALTQALQAREQAGLLRERLTLQSPQGPQIQLPHETLLSFCSNDYLGLANHPEVVAAMARGLNAGVGGGASHLVCGHQEAHHQLEQALAAFTGCESALLFSTGYMANLGVISALVGRADTVFQDKLNHASLIDGGLLSRARMQRYHHADVQSLAERLQQDRAAQENKSQHRRLVVSDGVFSMDGDLAPLPALADLCARENAVLMLDDAHGFGVLGERGQGCRAHFGLSPAQVPVLVGTLGKALGTAGAFVAGSQVLCDYLVQYARTYIYTTAMPAALATATLTSLRLAQEESWRREHLQALVRSFRERAAAMGYRLMDSETPIQPLLVGSSQLAVRLSAVLREAGVLVTAIRPPTVAQGAARLRVTFSAAHTFSHLERLLDALQKAARQIPQVLYP